MSDPITQAAAKLPDVWYDWYARLIPGVIGVLLFAFSYDFVVRPLGGSESFLVLLFGYVAGHFVAPFSSWATRRFEFAADKTRRDRLVKCFTDEGPPSSADLGSGRPAELASKAHAEAVSSLSGFIFLTAVGIGQVWAPDRLPKVIIWVLGFGCLACFTGWIQRIAAFRDKRHEAESQAKP